MAHPNRARIKKWSEHLCAFRDKYDLTQNALADYLEISLRTYQNFEYGVTIPPPYLKRALRDLETTLRSKQIKLVAENTKQA